MKLSGLFRTTIACVALSVTSASAQQASRLPVDPQLRIGQLPNGLTYYIRANKEPKQRADFYIAQNVGAILENDTQNGLAHFLEHMAFNGTTHFPGKTMVNYLEKIGVKFGADINAHTGLDETVYTLCDVPTLRTGIVDSALLILRDWSNGISLEGKEIDAERGVVREEWRTSSGAERRMWTASNKQKYAGSQYAKRDVIGDTAIINNFSYDTLRDFYKKWYHPDLQAILIVGDVNVDQVEAKIKSLFSDIPAVPGGTVRPVYDIPGNRAPIVSIVKDPEARTTHLELEYKHDKLPAQLAPTMEAYQRDIVNGLIASMLGHRFEEITQRADAPFVGAYAYYGELVKSKDAFQWLAVPKDGQEDVGLKALLTEAEKVRRFGFLDSELARARKEMLTSLDKQYQERAHQKSNDLIEEYVRHFLNAENVPGIEWEYQTLHTWLPSLKLEAVNELVRAYVTDSNLIVSIMAPDKPSVRVPERERVLQMVQEVQQSSLTAPADQKIDKPLVSTSPKAGRIVSQQKNKSLACSEWQLSNGVKVVIKPTSFKTDEILLSAFSEGGLSKLKDVNDLATANLAADIVQNNGLGDFSAVELSKILAGKVVNVSPYISAYEEGFSGSSSIRDFDTMMQLLYLYFTAPRRDDNAFQAMMNGYQTLLANGASNPGRVFSDSVSLTVTNHHPRTVLMNLKTLATVNQDKALSIYRERFADPSDFTFVFTGNIDPNEAKFKKLISIWLGGLRTNKQHEDFSDNGVRRPKGKVSNYFTHEMTVRKASNLVLYSGTMPYTLQNRVAMNAIADILDMRYVETLREQAGGTYGVGVGGDLSKVPVHEAKLYMQFDTDPLKQKMLIEMIHSEVNEIVNHGPRPDDLNKVKENLWKKYQEDLEDNNWWNAALQSYYRTQWNMATDYKAAVDALSPSLIQATLRTLVTQGNVIEVVMSPSKL